MAKIGSQQPRRAPSRTRTILAAVAGGSPAIITETLWALMKDKSTRVDEVRIITTEKGKSAIINTLLNPKDSKFKSCVKELGVNYPILFNEQTVFVLDDGKGGKLEDIRTDADNELAANQICKLLREWTKEDSRLVCSVAGGRKTMSIYLTIAMMLYGRADDRLFHVLVNPEEFEFCKDFFHPYRKARKLGLYDRSGNLIKHLSTAAARIDLAEIQFVKLRVLGIAEAFGELTSYSGIVSAVQDRLEFIGRAVNADLRIHCVEGPHNRIPIEVAGRVCHLQAAAGFIYSLVALKTKGGSKGVRIEEITPRDIKRVYSLVTGEPYLEGLWGTDFDFVAEWEGQLSLQRSHLLTKFKKSVQVAVSRANEALNESRFPSDFLIKNLDRSRRGKGARALYTIQVSPDRISFPSVVRGERTGRL